QGYTIVPIQIHLKNGFAKVLVGVGKGKKHYDRREDLKQKEAKRDVARALKESQQY
ncbi:SsrA-binding protein, partial [Microvirga sp. 3-52]|nr:SsrA-binding protein [Microvirga sp. 3-52]